MKTLPIYHYRGRLWATSLPCPFSNDVRALGFALEPVEGKPNYARFSLRSAEQVGRINEEAINLIWRKHEPTKQDKDSRTH
jgi:hypothetical protein